MIGLTAIEGILTGGPIFILACIIFYMYRADRKASEQRLKGILEKDQETRERQTIALTELTTYIQRLNGRG